MKREVETAMVVFVLRLAELLGELGRGPEDHAPVELVFVCPMAALDLSTSLGATPRNLRWITPRSRRCQVKSVPMAVNW